MDMDYTAFAINLRYLIRSNGTSQAELCDELGIPSATLSRYINDKREPKVSNVILIANHFGVSVDWMLGLNGKQFDVFPQETMEVADLYSVASPDDRRVVQAVLNKYRKE